MSHERHKYEFDRAVSVFGVDGWNLRMASIVSCLIPIECSSLKPRLGPENTIQLCIKVIGVGDDSLTRLDKNRSEN